MGRIITTVAGRNVIPLGQMSGKNKVYVTPLSGNIRYVNVRSSNLAEVSKWNERTDAEAIPVSSYVAAAGLEKEHYVLDPAEFAKLRLGDTIDVLDSGDIYQNTIRVTRLDNNKMYFEAKDKDNATLTNLDTNKLNLPEDPYIMESFGTMMRTDKNSFYYLIVFGENTLNIEEYIEKK